MLALFAGFGLGTLFLPGFAVFFPLEVAVAALAAFAGAFVGALFMGKVSMRFFQGVVGRMLLLVAMGLMPGLI